MLKKLSQLPSTLEYYYREPKAIMTNSDDELEKQAQNAVDDIGRNDCSSDDDDEGDDDDDDDDDDNDDDGGGADSATTRASWVLAPRLAIVAGRMLSWLGRLGFNDGFEEGRGAMSGPGPNNGCLALWETCVWLRLK
jgi:hypothetical protein